VAKNRFKALLLKRHQNTILPSEEMTPVFNNVKWSPEVPVRVGSRGRQREGVNDE
jgi:hypothetical protein